MATTSASNKAMIFFKVMIPLHKKALLFNVPVLTEFVKIKMIVKKAHLFL